MGRLPFSQVIFVERPSGEESVKTWLESLLPDERLSLLERIHSLQQGNIDGLIHIRDNIYELSIRAASVVMVYIAIDIEAGILTVLQGIKIPISAQSNLE